MRHPPSQPPVPSSPKPQAVKPLPKPLKTGRIENGCVIVDEAVTSEELKALRGTD